MNLNNRKVCRFRTNVDPMIGPKPKNAFDNRKVEGGMSEWEFEVTPAGIYVRLPVRDPNRRVNHWEEHVIPYANLSSIMLTPEEEKEEPELKGDGEKTSKR